MEALNITLESFVGPLDLLCHLIEKNEINIYDIPIAELTDQYIDFISKSKKNMEAMSEFILMAATLLEIKSKMLIPQLKNNDIQELDPRTALVTKIEEYKKFKFISEGLKEREEIACKYLYRTIADNIVLPIVKENISVKDSLKGTTLSDIHNVFINALASRELKTDKIRSTFDSVERDLFTIEDKIDYIKDTLKIFHSIKFSQIFKEQTLKIEIIVTFLALLELIKMKLVNITQSDIFSEIIISQSSTLKGS